MKQIEYYQAQKYQTAAYEEVESGIYLTKDTDGELVYVTSLTFVQEPELDEGTGGLVSQYPLEDVLDQFYCHITDFYSELNTEEAEKVCLEFASPDLEDVQKLRSIIGKHVYNRTTKDGVELVIE